MEVTELQQEVSELEREKELLVEERKKELIEQCRREGWINGANLQDDDLDKLCRRYLVTEITATLNHRKKLENKLAQYEPEIVALEKRFQQQQQVQAQIMAMQQLQHTPSPSTQGIPNHHGVKQQSQVPLISPKGASGPQQMSSQQHQQQQQALNMNGKEKKNLSRSRSQEWPDIPDMAKINEKNPEILAKKIIETAREFEAGKVSRKGTNPIPEQTTAAVAAHGGRRKSGSGATVEMPAATPPPSAAEKQAAIPAPKVNFFEDRLKSLITSVLNEDSPSSSSEGHAGMPSLSPAVPMGAARGVGERDPPQIMPPQQQQRLQQHPHHPQPPPPNHLKNMHHHNHHHSPSHSRHPPSAPNSQFLSHNQMHHPHAHNQHHQGPPQHGPPPPPHVIPINVPLNPLLPYQSKPSSQQMSPGVAAEPHQQGQKKKIQLSPDITSVTQARNNLLPHASPGKAALKNHLTPSPSSHENRAVRNLNFNQTSNSGHSSSAGDKSNNPRTISDLMTSEIETSLGIAPRSSAYKTAMSTASPPVRGMGTYSPISRPNSNENIPDALSSYGGSRASVLVHPPRTSSGSDRGHHSSHHSHGPPASHGNGGGDDSLMNEGLAAGLKARIISMAKSSAITLENKVDGSNGGGGTGANNMHGGNSSANSAATASNEKSQPASTTILLNSPLVKEKKVLGSPSGGVTVEVVLKSSDGADDMDVDRNDNGNASVLRVVRKRVSDPSNVST